MSYVEQTLGAGERVVYRARLHWFAYAGPVFLTSLGLLGLAAGIVESIGVDQGVTRRLLEFGTVSIGGSGGARERFKAIADPLEFRRQVQAQTQAQVA
jgi:hypothetical protein